MAGSEFDALIAPGQALVLDLRGQPVGYTDRLGQTGTISAIYSNRYVEAGPDPGVATRQLRLKTVRDEFQDAGLEPPQRRDTAVVDEVTHEIVEVRPGRHGWIVLLLEVTDE
ncbi:MAG: hypothetical protein ACLFSI_02595 [Halorhodospira sp.]